MKRWSLIFLALAACADPAVLDVKIRIEEIELDELTLKITRGQDQKQIFDCRLPFHEDAEGECPDDDGEGEWEDPRELSFLLYGKPSTPVTIELQGMRGGRSVTTTATAVELPSNEGERRMEQLTLVGLTRERFRCSYKIEPVPGGEPSLNPEEQTSLAVIAGPGAGSSRLALVSARGRLGKVRRSRTEDACALEYVPIVEPDLSGSPGWCHVVPGSLVVGPMTTSADRGVLAAASCATGNQARLKASAFSLALDQPARAFELTLPRSKAQISAPVLADVVGADGRREVVFFARNGTMNGDPVELLAWQPGPTTTATTTAIALPGVLLDNNLVPPIVVPSRLGDLLVISGGHGAWGVVRDGRFVRIGDPGDIESGNLRGQSVIANAAGDGFEIWSVNAVRVGTEVQGILRRRQVTIGAGGTFTFVTEEQPVVREISNNLDLRLAIGSIDADDDQEIVMSQNGYAQAFGRTGGAAVTVDLWSGAIPGEQAILLANLDRLSGAELISVGLGSSLVQASDAGGRALDGWPLSLGGQGGRRHVVISELDGARDPADPAALRDAEIVALSSDGIFETITLGPGSYDSAHVPWPAPNRGSLGPTAYLSDADPQIR